MFDNYFNYLSYYKWWKNLDKFIFSIIICFFIIGLFFSLVSTSLIASDKLDTNSYFFFFKHLTFVAIGLIIIFVLSYIEIKLLYTISIYIFFVSLVLLILVQIFGVEIKGSKRWLDLIFLPRIQPIEFVKPFFIVILALIISNKKIPNFTIKFIFSFSLTFLISLLLIMQPDFGQTLLIGFSWITLIFVSGINLFFLVLVSLSGLVTLIYVAFYIPKFQYIKSRILSFFNSETGSHNAQSEKAIDSITYPAHGKTPFLCVRNSDEY